LARNLCGVERRYLARAPSAIFWHHPAWLESCAKIKFSLGKIIITYEIEVGVAPRHFNVAQGRRPY
jgi:hypothetical protein